MGREKVSVSLTKEEIARLDSIRGDIPRSDYIAHLIMRNRIPNEIKDERLISEFSKCTSAIRAYIASDSEDETKRLDIYTKICDMTEMIKELTEH